MKFIKERVARTLDEVIDGLPPEQQRDIAALAAQLIEEEMKLRDLRRRRAPRASA